MKIVLGAVLENISTRADNTIKLTLGSQEIDSSMAGNLFQLRNKFIKVLLTDDNITPLEENVMAATPIPDGKKVKSHSQRLRNVMFVYFKNEGYKESDFDDLYKTEMERLIDLYKGKLD